MITEFPLSHYCSADSKIAETSSFELWRGHDTQTKEVVCLWRAKRAIPTDSPLVAEFLQRMQLLTALPGNSPVAIPIAFGVDTEGIAFYLLPNLDGIPLKLKSFDLGEAERLLLTMVRSVGILHEYGVAVVDLCPEAFWVTRDGGLILTQLGGSLGDPTPYAAPEHTGESILGVGLGEDNAIARMDVFSLGALGVSLCSGKVHASPSELESVLSSLKISPQLRAVLGAALQIEPGMRVGVATEMQSSFYQDHMQAQLPAIDKREVSKLTDYARSATSTYSPVGAWRKNRAGDNKKSSTSAKRGMNRGGGAGGLVQGISPKKLFMIAGIVFVAMVVVGALIGKGKREAKSALSDLAQLTDNGALREAIDRLGRDDISTAKKQADLNALANNDDPVAHRSMVEQALLTRNVGERRLIEEAMASRARRLKLERTSEVLRTWLANYRADEIPASYEVFLSVLEPSLPQAQINASLAKLISIDARLGGMLVGALALDTGRINDFHAPLKLLIDAANLTPMREEREALALMMWSSAVVENFGSELVQYVSQLKRDDLLFVFTASMRRQDLLLQPLGQRMVEESVLPPIRKLFLDALLKSKELRPDLQKAIAAGVVGEIGKHELGEIARWVDDTGTSLLVAALVETKSDAVRQEAFEMLSARPDQAPVIGPLLRWVKNNEWEKRLRYARPIGVLGLPMYFSDQVIEKALVALAPAMGDQLVLTSLLKSKNRVMASEVLREYGDRLDPPEVYSFLYDSEPRVRMAAVRALGGNSDMDVIREVMDAYERESVEEIRALYRQLFWMLEK